MPDKNIFVPTQYIADQVSRYFTMYSNQRRSFVRRWYENNFFDDGQHFRYVSRLTGKIIDQSEVSSDLPMRAIPKASRQIRGIANLLSSLEPTPVVYPEKTNKSAFPDPNEYLQSQQIAKNIAMRTGHWLQEEFKKQELKEKIIQMIILTCKHGVSFLQVWPDAVDEKIRSEVYDAFDIYLDGTLTSIYNSPAIVKAVPEQIKRIQANELFDPQAVERLSPDNKYASDEVKQAYMSSLYNNGQENENAATLILKEAFMKEYLNENNYQEAKALSEKTGAMEGKKMGDVMIRHVFEAGGEKLMDEYVDLSEYPIVDLRLEPGRIYQTPLIERFIPANKSLDVAASRIERWMNTMVVGTWLTRDGEDLQITNIPGGQKVSYKQTPPVQSTIQPLPNTVFNFITMLEGIIEEQGASTSALGKLPEGVKSGVAIESIKSTEYDNLKISTDMLKQTVRRIGNRMLDIADKYFLNAQTVYYMENGEPNYFDIMGQRGVKFRQANNMPVGEVIPIKGDSYVDIQIESGAGFTQQGKKETAQQVIQFMTQLAAQNLLTTDVVKMVVQKALEMYQFGSTQEIMEAFDTGSQSAPITEEQMTQMKIAMLQAMKDAGVVGPEADKKLVMSTKVGVVEAMKDTGMMDNMNQPKEQPNKGPSQSISFKDLPPEGKQQMAAAAGIQLDPNQIRRDELQNKIIDTSLRGANNGPKTSDPKRTPTNQ